LNARNFFEYNRRDDAGNEIPGTAIRATKNNDYGFVLGGPIRKEKTFFFTNLALMNMRQQIATGYENTIPIPEFGQGDFSQLLTNSPTGALLQVGTDALGRPVYWGEIFDPSSTRLENGVPVRDGYGFDATTGLPIAGQANIIPADDPLRSQIAAKVVALMPPPDRSGLQYNGYGGGGSANRTLDVKTWLLRLDHTFNPNFKTSTTFWMNERPRTTLCYGVQACNVKYPPTQSEKNTDYIGVGVFQRIANRFAHQQFDWIVKPNVFNHTTVSYDRWYMGGWGLSAGVGWLSKLGIKGFPAEYDKLTSFPIMTFSGLIPYSQLGISWQKGFQAVNRCQFVDDLTWITGKHTIKMGFEWRWHEFNLVGWGRTVGGQHGFNSLETGGYDAQGNNLWQTGDPFASFLLGQVHFAMFPISLDPSFSERYWSPWINDEIKLTSKLTLNLGLRFDWQTPRTERHDRMSTFDPTAMNPVGVPGAVIFAGTGANRSGRRGFEEPKADAWGPRLSLAYRLGDKNVIRGGYGIYYAGVQFDMWISAPTVGYETFNFAPNLTNGLYPAGCTDATCSGGYRWWDDGFPQSWVKYPPNIDPAVANGGQALAVSKEGVTLPRYQNWSLSWERQLGPNLLLDISYVGNHGTRLVTSSSAAGWPLDNMNHPSVLAYAAKVLGADINSPEAQAAGIKKPYPTFFGNVAQALRPFPQYYGAGVYWRNLQMGSSVYHSLQAKLDKRFASGLQFRLAYVWSKLIVGTLSDAGNAYGNPGTEVQNPLCTRSCERAVSADDVPHTLILAYTYELPFGQGKRFAPNAPAAVNKLIGGWSLSGLQRYQSGRPLQIFMANDLAGILFNWGKRPNKVGDGYGEWTGDPNASLYLDRTGWADPGPLAFGDAPRMDAHARTFPIYSEDFSLIKDTFVYKEHYKLRFATQVGNIFNRHFFCNPVTNWSSPAFGLVYAQCDTPRRIQFGLRLDW